MGIFIARSLLGDNIIHRISEGSIRKPQKQGKAAKRMNRHQKARGLTAWTFTPIKDHHGKLDDITKIAG
jgi:hypothetical protein